MSICLALAAVMADVQAVRKTERNTQQGFLFRGIDAVVNAVGPALRKHGVIVVPRVMDYQYGTVEVGQKRTVMGHVRVTVAYTFYGPDGDWIEATAIGEAMDSGDKATAKAMSVAFRTALLQSLCLPTDEPDPDHDVYERAEANQDTQERAEPKPVMGSDQQAALARVMRSAKDIAALDALGQHAATFEMSDEQRDNLRAVYLDRKNELEAAS